MVKTVPFAMLPGPQDRRSPPRAARALEASDGREPAPWAVSQAPTKSDGLTSRRKTNLSTLNGN